MQQHHCTRMRLMCRIEILLRKSERKSDTLHHLAQYRQTRFMKNHSCFTEFRQSFWPVPRRKVTVIGRSEPLLDVCRLAWVQTAQPGSTVTARLGFGCLRKIEKLNAPGEQLVYYALRHVMTF